MLTSMVFASHDLLHIAELESSITMFIAIYIIEFISYQKIGGTHKWGPDGVQFFNENQSSLHAMLEIN